MFPKYCLLYTHTAISVIVIELEHTPPYSLPAFPFIAVVAESLVPALILKVVAEVVPADIQCESGDEFPIGAAVTI